MWKGKNPQREGPAASSRPSELSFPTVLGPDLGPGSATRVWATGCESSPDTVLCSEGVFRLSLNMAGVTA